MLTQCYQTRIILNSLFKIHKHIGNIQVIILLRRKHRDISI